MGGPRKTMSAEGWKGGNTTRGPDRKGYRGGRKRSYPEGTVTWPVALTLSDQEYAIALYLGHGNAGRGLRSALLAAAPYFEFYPIPATRLEAQAHLETAGKRIREVADSAFRKLALPYRLRNTHPTEKEIKAPIPEEWDDT